MFKKDDVAAVVVDVQNAFCEGGTLSAPGAEAIIPVINRALQHFGTIVFSKDWHPKNHISFASQHPGAEPFSNINVGGQKQTQTLWPDHAVQGTTDAEFHPALDVSRADLVVLKGNDPSVDSYSAFTDNKGKNSTGLDRFLKERNIKAVFIMGLTLEYCVRWTALDAVKLLQMPIYVMQDATCALDQASAQNILKELKQAGVHLVTSREIPSLVS